MKFFSDKELNSFEDQVAKGCNKCKLNTKCKHPKMRVAGKGKKKVLVVGDYPGEQDDQIGRPFMGNANIDFLNLLREKGCNPLEDFWFTNAINCRKSNKGNKTLEPSDVEIKCCRAYVEEIIKELEPKDIIVLGDFAVKSFFPFLDKANVAMLRGFPIPDQQTKTWIHTTISPKTIEKQSFNKNLYSVYNRDLTNILKRLGMPFECHEEPEVEQLLNAKDIISHLAYLIDTKNPCYIDYETTGLKPYFNGHKIVSMSIASFIEYSKKDLPLTVSFPYQYRNYHTPEEQNAIRYHIKKILASGIALSAHNIKFEDSWSRNILKMRPKNWTFDTQIAAHILDNRKGITGLKTQVYLKFGVRPYNEHIEPLLKQKEGSEFNRVEEIPLKDLLHYGGLDSAYGIELEQIQREELESKNLWSPYNFFHRGNLLMSNLQEKGICIDEEYYHEQDKILTVRIDKLNHKLMTSKEALLFKKKERREIDPASGLDLGLLFYTHMNAKKVMTEKGNLSVDKLTLEKIDNPFVKDLLYLRKLEKTKGTYFAQFLREIYNGRMNPFFNLNIPVSFRSSSSQPNFQNIPTREEEIKKLIRSGVKASPGRQLLFWDGQGMEVCTSACYHRDPNMVKYITDPKSDMHRDCFSFDTKILTENGFKFYNEIKDGDKVAQYNPNMDKIEYVVPLDRICHEYIGDMYYIRKKYIDVLITPNHRLYLKKYGYDEYKITLAKDVKKASYYIKTGSDIIDIIKSPKFYFPPVYGEDTNKNKKYQDEFCIKQDDMFELLGYLITDGHFKYHKQKAYRINLSQIKEYSRKIMKSCIDRIKSYANFNFHEESDKWSLSNKVFCNWLCENFGVGKINRKLPKFITHASIKQLQIFFDACMLGDGHLGKSGNFGTFYTISTQLIEDFQFICMRLGYSSRIDKPVLKGNRAVQLYAIRMIFNSERNVKARDLCFGTEEYKGKVFCFTVPSGILVTQRNNKISIQGNCAADIWMIPHNEVTKDIRFYAKNLYVFATFYGSYWQDTGTHLWETCIDSLELKTVSGYQLRQHMADKGITTLNQFLEHCKEVERIFWKERFKVYDKWRWDLNEEYKQNGYIENKMGFVFSGIMNRKQISNYPIQSTAFHLLLWSLIQIEDIAIKERWESNLIAQIHDEGIMDAVPGEIPWIIATAKHVTEVLMPKEFPWVNVPFGLDISISPVNGNWYQKKEI